MAIGKAKFKDFEQFSAWAKSDGKCWPFKENVLQHVWDNHRNKYDEIKQIALNLFEENEWERFWNAPSNNERKITELHKLVTFSEEYGVPFELLYSNEVYTVIRFGKKSFLVPSESLILEFHTDYSDHTLLELKQIQGAIGTTQLAVIEGSLTVTSVKENIEEKQEEINILQNQKKELYQEYRNELDRIQRELKETYDKKTEILNEMKQKMETEMENLKNQLFLLNTEIYAIQCFMGETISFTKLKGGKQASVEEPVVLYQKIRYLDEELARMISLYDVEESDVGLFEQYLTSCEYAADHFAPGPKSINLIRLTRTETGFTKHEQFENMLMEYDIYHGGMIGILVRNGENLYIGWTDADMINIKDENIFYAPKKAEYAASDGYEKPNSVSKEEVASRYFIFAILQGLIHQGTIMKLPEEEQFLKGGGKYIIFSMADGYLEDNRFGLFADIMDRCNTNIQKGDYILCILTLSAKQPKINWTYSNDRGRGEKNRTHDVNTRNNTIYQINLVESEEDYWVEYKYPAIHMEKDTPDKYLQGYASGRLKDIRLSEDCIDIKECNGTKYHYFVSLKKQYSYQSSSRANFEIFTDEFINLTFLNSVWLTYAIQNRKVGKWRLGGETVSYAYSVRYLNKALEFVKKREMEEGKLIGQFIKLPNEWQVLLSEWKLEKNVHTITEYQAKRFAKHCTEKHGAKSLSENKCFLDCEYFCASKEEYDDDTLGYCTKNGRKMIGLLDEIEEGKFLCQEE